MYTSPGYIDRHSVDLVDRGKQRKTTIEKSYPRSRIFSSRSITLPDASNISYFSTLPSCRNYYGHNITPTDNCLPGRREENE